MAQSQHISHPRLHGHHVQTLMTTLHRSPSAAHEHRRLNGNRRRVFEKKLAALQKLEDDCDHQHAAGASSESPSSFPRGHNFHVRVARVWVTCTHLLRGYDKLISPSKMLFEAQLADQRRHALAQKRIAERLRQADPPPPRSGRKHPSFQTRKLLKPTQHEEIEVEPGKILNNGSPITSCIKSWLQQPFVHLAHMAAKKLGDRHSSLSKISSARIPLVESLSCAEGSEEFS